MPNPTRRAPSRGSIALALAAVALLATPLSAQAPTATIKTTDLGKGPAIVLLPGLGSQRMQWMPTARKLLNGYKVVLADLPGHGESGMPDPFSFDAAAAMLDAVLAKQNPESTIVVAHGVGGMIAVLEAKAHPERMRGLIVIDGALKSPIVIPDQQKRYFIDYIEENYDSFLRTMFKPLGRDSMQGVEIYSKAALVPSQNVKAYMRQLLDADASGAAKLVRVPMLYVGSSKSWPDTSQWNSISKARGWDAVTQVKTRRIGNSGYLLMADQPDSLANVIMEFAKRVMSKDVASSD